MTWLALLLAVVIVLALNAAHAVGYFRGQQAAHARTQGLMDALVLQSAQRDRDLARLRAEAAALTARQAALVALAGQSANREPA